MKPYPTEHQHEGALEWLDAVEKSPHLPPDAATLAAFLSYGWTGEAQPCQLSAVGALDATGWNDWRRFNAAVTSLRTAGYLTGRGRSEGDRERRFILRIPAEETRTERRPDDLAKKIRAALRTPTR